MNAHCFIAISFAILTQSLTVGYDICLPVFKDDKYASDATLKDYDDMGMLLVEPDQIIRSPQKKVNVNQAKPKGADCADLHHLCWYWALGCECSKNPGYMHAICPQSCGTCGGCQDTVTWCEKTIMGTSYRYCYTQPLFAINMCRKTCRMCRGDCYDHHVKCQEWKRKGACDKNPHFMYRYCMKSCGSCD